MSGNREGIEAMSGNVRDVVIIGAGVTGAALARLLSAYELDVALVEKEADVGFGVSKANSGIVHAGFHHDAAKTLKARLELRGNLMFERLQRELGFPFKRIGILMVAFSGEDMKTVRRLYEQGVRNGVPGLEICGHDRMRTLEPKLNPDVVGGLYAPSGGVVEPYRFVFSLVESAKLNGVELLTSFHVVAARREGPAWRLDAADGRSITARRVVNAAGLYADTVSALFNAEPFLIRPRKGEEYLLDRNSPACPGHVLFPVPSRESKGMLVIPTVEGTVMIGPTAEMIEDKEDITTSSGNLEKAFSSAAMMVSGISRRDIITSFAGLRPTCGGEDFLICRSTRAPGLIQAAGIQSPGLTAAPAVAEEIRDLLKADGQAFREKAGYIPHLTPFPSIRNLNFEELDALATRDAAFGNIVCRCEQISEAEVVDAVRKGHVTLDGVKFYTRAGMGRCQGGFCSFKVMRIIARETGIPMEEITKRGAGSRVVAGRLDGAEPDHV